jgi:hypothetical protein
MKGWVRRQVDQLCQHAQAEFGGNVEFGGVPGAEFFGATGFAGDTGLASDAGHRHEMPDIEDILADDAFFFDDAMLTAPNNVYVIHSGGSAGAAPSALGGRDDVGSLGAFGSFDVITSNGTRGSSGVMIANAAANNNSSTLQIHLWQRVKELVIRVAPATSLTDLQKQALVAVGAMRSSLNFGNVALPGTVGAITDGVYFLLTTDATGAGNWFATTMNNSVSTSVDTGVGAIISGSSIGYQNFKIGYDHPTTTATFFIDDVQVASISTNVPPSTRKIAGFGKWVQNVETGVVRQITSSFDRVLYDGDRVAQT